MQPLFKGEFFNKLAEDLRTGVRNAVNGVPDSVNQPLSVKSLAVHESIEIICKLCIVARVDALFHIVEHLHDADICTAVTRSLQGCKRRRNGGICIRSRGSDDVRRECRVVSAAVFCMQNERHIEDTRFKFCIPAVLPQHIEDILRHGQRLLRTVDDERVIVVIKARCRIRIDGKNRHFRNELQTLAHHVFRRSVIGIGIVRKERQNTAHERIHHVG